MSVLSHLINPFWIIVLISYKKKTLFLASNIWMVGYFSLNAELYSGIYCCICECLDRCFCVLIWRCGSLNELQADLPGSEYLWWPAAVVHFPTAEGVWAKDRTDAFPLLQRTGWQACAQWEGEEVCVCRDELQHSVHTGIIADHPVSVIVLSLLTSLISFPSPLILF